VCGYLRAHVLAYVFFSILSAVLKTQFITSNPIVVDFFKQSFPISFGHRCTTERARGSGQAAGGSTVNSTDFNLTHVGNTLASIHACVVPRAFAGP